MKRILPCLMLSCLFLLYGQDIRVEEEKKVLLINSYHEGYKWNDDVINGLQSSFFAGNISIDLRIEFMDTRRHPDEAYLQQLYKLYEARYSHENFDLVISSDDAAYDFIQQKGRQIFGSTPVVFCGLNSYRPEAPEIRKTRTGVVEGFAIEETLDIALKLHPGRNRIYYISDNSVTGTSSTSELLKIIPDYRKGISFHKLTGKNPEELARQVSELEQDSLVLFFLYFNDDEGRFYNYKQALQKISSASGVPVYGLWDFFLGYGITGGKLTSGFYQGKTAGDMAMEILKGKSPGEIPVQIEKTTVFTFDYNELSKYGVKPTDLPEGSTLINYSQNEQKQVLLLHSYHNGFTWTDDIERGIRKVLDQSQNPINLIVDYMDVKRNPAPDYYRNIHHILTTKYELKPLDAIITSDDDAFRYITKLEKKRENPVPVIFCGLNNYDAKEFENYPYATGVVENYDIENTILSALKMKRGINRVIVVNDTTLTGKANKKRIDRSIPGVKKLWDGDLVFEFWEDLNMSEIQEQAQELPENCIILLMTFNKDRSGNYYSYCECLKLISEYSSVPVFGVWDFLLGKGLTGGKLTSGFMNGELAGELSLRVLRGEKPADIPVITTCPTAYMYDYRQLKRYDIALKTLPPESRIINQPFSLTDYYRAHSTAIKVSSVILLIGLIIIMIPVILILRKNVIQRNSLLREKEIILHEVHHRIKNNMLTMKNLLAMQSLNSGNSEAREILKDAQSRIQSMGILYDKLYRSDNISNIAVNTYIPDLLREITSLFPHENLEIQTSIEPLKLDAKTVSSLGIIINELVTNMMKYAFHESSSCLITADVHRENGYTVISIGDNGCGLPDSFSLKESRGFGLQLVQILVRELQGTLTLDKSRGTTFIIRIRGGSLSG